MCTSGFWNNSSITDEEQLKNQHVLIQRQTQTCMNGTGVNVQG